MKYQDMEKAALQAEQAALQERYDAFVARGLKLNMARGKPSPEQLDLSAGLLSAIQPGGGRASTDSTPGSTWPADSAGDDVRNYGGLLGIPEARALMADVLGVPAANVMVGNNSSLTMMYDTVARSVALGVRGFTPWSKLEKVRFLCPAPGYDRHFAVSAAFGIDNIAVPMTPDGPDMATVEHYVNTDASVKGIWCVPKYSNPQGVTYSDEVVRRFAELHPAAGDFRIFWDNAYAVHDLDPAQPARLADLKSACEQAGNPDIWYMFASTSKITFAGSGIAALATSADNLASISQQIAFQTIGPDKVNQLRHVAFLQDQDGVRQQMRQHASILAPKFAVVQETLQRELAGTGTGTWTQPRGGYFISFEGLPNTARRTVALAKAAGVVLTGAGATWPYGEDPADSNIRIAPSYPSVEELALASELLSVCVRLAAIEVLL
ncbi:MAG: aminotransferase [Coriobacteriales bacterium]|jgi:DNA-binding transcriptional MocR family regulator|nr:aminotransferase [Coriobacteriales bacterium]